MRQAAAAAGAIYGCNANAFENVHELGSGFSVSHNVHGIWAYADAGRRLVGLEIFLASVFLGAHVLSVRGKNVLQRLFKVGRRQGVVGLNQEVHGNLAPIVNLIEVEEDALDKLDQESEVVEKPHHFIRVLLNACAKYDRAWFLKIRLRCAK